jgi:hypothetical protein
LNSICVFSENYLTEYDGVAKSANTVDSPFDLGGDRTTQILNHFWVGIVPTEEINTHFELLMFANKPPRYKQNCLYLGDRGTF